MTIPIPMRMMHLKRDNRGYPIPAGVLIDAEGQPQFTINDEAARLTFVREDRCAICGGTHTDARWFVGGPRAAFHQAGAYLDPPLHDECAHYALQVCPFLAAPHYGKRIDDRKLGPTDPHVLLVDPTQIAERPEVFVAVEARRTVRFGPYVKPSRPYVAVEFWRYGERLSYEDGKAIVDRVMAEPMPERLAPRIVRGGSS
jgi:hypothetical protein